MYVERWTRIRRMDIKGERKARARGCFFPLWQVTTRTVSSRAIKAPGGLKDSGKINSVVTSRCFAASPKKNKSLYAHGGIFIARRRRRVAIIMPRGPTTTQMPALDLQRLKCTTFTPTHLFPSTPLILHNYTPTTDGTFGAGLDLPVR